jgi:hypothetical protein
LYYFGKLQKGFRNKGTAGFMERILSLKMRFNDD